MVFIDTNVLVSYWVISHPFHDRAVRLMDSLLDNDELLALSPQIIGEAYVTMTSPTKLQSPFTPNRFLQFTESLLGDPAVIFLAPSEPAIKYAVTAAVKKSVTSAKIFDLLIYGTMREHSIKRLATFNEKDFEGLEEIEIVS
jgi:predicted nucleic acid-binding protein